MALYTLYYITGSFFECLSVRPVIYVATHVCKILMSLYPNNCHSSGCLQSIFLSVCLRLSVCPSVRLFSCMCVCVSVCNLSVCPLSVRVSVRLSVCPYVCLFVCLYACVSVNLSISLFAHMSVCSSIYLHVRLPLSIICQLVYPSVYLSLWLSVCLILHLPLYLRKSRCLCTCMSFRSLSQLIRRHKFNAAQTKCIFNLFRILVLNQCG